ncbi:MAG: tetratricopeptide repeat protein [Saprospiraceae bacterium]
MKKVTFSAIVPLVVSVLIPLLGYSQGYQIGPLLQENVYPLQSFGDEQPQFLMLAQTYYQLLDQEKTEFALDNAILHNPNSIAALLKRAQFNEMIGLESKAAEDLRRVNELNPYAINLYGLNGFSGRRSLLAFQPKSALLELSTEKRLGYYFDFLYEKICEGSIDEMELDLAEAAIDDIESNNLPQALAVLDGLLNMYPESAIGYDLKGVIYLKMDQLEDARQALVRATELQPEFAIAWYNLGRVTHKMGQKEDAQQYFNKSIALQSDLTKAYFDRALLRKELGDEEGAVADYNQIIMTKGDLYMEAYPNRGLTRKMLGDFNGALNDINRAIEKYPTDAMLYKNRGNLFFMFDHPRQAIEDYTKAIQLNDDLAEAYYNRGLANILIQNRLNGCNDLNEAASLGFEKAAYKLQYFCVE